MDRGVTTGRGRFETGPYARGTSGLTAEVLRGRRQTELLEEYRTRLIADVVTGKLDVREAAAGLAGEGDDDLGDSDVLG